MALFNSVEELFNLELYEEVVFVNELVPEKSRGTLTPKCEFLLNCYFADAYHQLEKFSLAIRQYNTSLTLLAKLPKGVLKHNSELQKFSEAELRFRLSKALVKMKKFDDAIVALQKIPENELTPKMRYAQKSLLAGKDSKNHITLCIPILEGIVQGAPSALLIQMQLLKLGTRNLNNIEVPTAFRNIYHVELALTASEMIGNKLYNDSVQRMANHAGPASFRLLSEAGGLLYSIGQEREAREMLRRAHNVCPDFTNNMDIYAFLLYDYKKDNGALEELAMRLIREDPESIEANVAFGYLSASLGFPRGGKALQIASNACKIFQFNKRPSTQALLLRSTVLLELEKYDELVKFNQEIRQFEPCNFNIQKNHIIALYKKNSLRDAKNAVQSLWLQAPEDPRVRLLRATCLLKNNNAQNKAVFIPERRRVYTEIQEAQKLLEKLVEEYPEMVEAFWPLIDLYEKMGKTEEARVLIQNLMNMTYHKDVLARLNHLLASIYQKEKEPLLAFEHVHYALANDREEASGELANLDVAIYQTPSPLAPVARAPPPHAPRRNRPARASSDMDSSVEFVPAMDNANGMS